MTFISLWNNNNTKIYHNKMSSNEDSGNKEQEQKQETEEQSIQIEINSSLSTNMESLNRHPFEANMHKEETVVLSENTNEWHTIKLSPSIDLAKEEEDLLHQATSNSVFVNILESNANIAMKAEAITPSDPMPIVPTVGNVDQTIVLPSAIFQTRKSIHGESVLNLRRLSKQKEKRTVAGFGLRKSVITRMRSTKMRISSFANRVKAVMLGKPPQKIYDICSIEDVKNVKMLIIDLIYAFLCFGMPVYRIEYHVNLITTCYATSCMVDYTGNGFIITFANTYDDENADTRYIKLKSATWNLHKVCLLDNLADDIASNRISITDAEKKIKQIIEQPPLYGHIIFTMIGYAVCAVSFALFMDSTWSGLIASIVCGAVVGMLTVLVPRYLPTISPILHSICAIACCVLSMCFKALFIIWKVPMQTLVVNLCSLLILLPGLSYALGVGELARRHVRAGLVRVVTGTIAAFQVGTVIYLVNILEKAIIPDLPYTAHPYPNYIYAAIMPLAAISFAVVLKSPRYILSTIFIILDSYIAFFVTRTLTNISSPALGSLVGAFGLQAVAKLYGWISGNHPSIVTICVILLQVPGSLSVKAFTFLIDSDVIDGITTLTQTMSVAMGIAIGLLLGDFLIPLHHKHDSLAKFPKMKFGLGKSDDS
jgi:uncharacterized membrane protein YjjP (DUF1212 family)